MNNGEFNDKLLNEELEKINSRLKENENITLPEGLSPDAIAEKIEGMAQTGVPKAVKKTSKRKIKRYVISSVATAAAFVIAVTSVMVVRPWEKEPAKPVVPETQVEDYAQIEAMFSDYSDKYQEYRMKQKFNLFGEIFGTKEESFLVDEDFVVDGAATDMAAPGAGVDAESSTIQNTTNKGYGETNEQVAGVSEADIIKNDGRYLYVVEPSNANWDTFWEVVNDAEAPASEETTTDSDAQSTPGYNPQEEIIGDSAEEKIVLEKNSKGMPIMPYDCAVAVIEPDADGKMKKVASINITKPADEDIYFMQIVEMYVKGNDLIIIAECRKFSDEFMNGEKGYYSRYYYAYYDTIITMAACIDISDKGAPVEKWRVYQDGDYISSRLIDNQFVMLSDYYVDITEDKEQIISNCVPMVACGDDEMQRIPAGDLCVMEGLTDTSYLVATTLDINNKDSVKNLAVLGAGSDVYCTTEALYAVSTRYKNEGIVGEVFGVTTYTTKIYKFDIRDYNISYLGCGEVDGFTLNQFSMDEHNGYLRVATSTGSWGADISNYVFVLDSDMNIVGKIEGIAPGETIKSVRFTGDTGYVVTFEQTDPLFVIDLSNPQKPEIKGELKIPGFSTYLHPVGENLVLGVGVDGDENGATNGLKVSLFDVTNPESPKETYKVTIPASNSAGLYSYVSSQAYHTHKALCWDAEESVMYIPYIKQIERWTPGDYSVYDFENTLGILAIRVNVKEKTLEKSKNYNYIVTERGMGFGFERATYIGDVVFGYTDSGKLMVSFDKDTQKQLHKLNID